jgi:hypothetical protein
MTTNSQTLPAQTVPPGEGEARWWFGQHLPPQFRGQLSACAVHLHVVPPFFTPSW